MELFLAVGTWIWKNCRGNKSEVSHMRRREIRPYYPENGGTVIDRMDANEWIDDEFGESDELDDPDELDDGE